MLAVVTNLMWTGVAWTWTYVPASFVLRERRYALGIIEDAIYGRWCLL